MSSLCECGCGEQVAPGKRFRQGHFSRSARSKEIHQGMRKAVEPPNPSGLCMCGCGEVTPLYQKSVPSRGYRIGDHLRYIAGHQVKEGAENHRWKGGRWVHKGGYVYAYAPDHPRANRDGNVYEHRLVMERTLGRPLTDKERVHHLNGIKTDNRPENLALMGSQSEHKILHGTEELQRYREEHPEAASEAGRKGAAARWGKVHRLELLITRMLLDDESTKALRAYVITHGVLPENDDFLNQAEAAHDPPPA